MAEHYRAGAALTGVHAAAQAEAGRFFGDGPVVPWRPHAPMGAVRRAVNVGALCAALAGAAAAWAIWPDTPGETTAALRGHEEVQDVEPPPYTASVSVNAPTPQRLPAALAIDFTKGTWRIDARDASRLAAANELARLNRMPLRGAAHLLDRLPPLELRWQGGDSAAAWQAVLGSGVSYVLQCARGRCGALIVEAGAASPGTLVHARPAATAAFAADGAPLPDNAAEAPPARERIDPPEPLHHD